MSWAQSKASAFSDATLTPIFPSPPVHPMPQLAKAECPGGPLSILQSQQLILLMLPTYLNAFYPAPLPWPLGLSFKLNLSGMSPGRLCLCLRHSFWVRCVSSELPAASLSWHLSSCVLIVCLFVFFYYHPHTHTHIHEIMNFERPYMSVWNTLDAQKFFITGKKKGEE